MIYGRFTEGELARRDFLYGKEYPFVDHGGKVYRITTLVPTLVGHSNYQAEECDPREAERWKAEREAEKQAQDKKDDDQAGGVREPRHPKPDEDSGAAKAVIPADVLKKLQAVADLPHDKPSVAEFARRKGWTRGRIPAHIKEAYDREFGVAED